jgi:hypothetical protein
MRPWNALRRLRAALPNWARVSSSSRSRGGIEEAGDGGLADPPGRRVDDSKQAHVVRGVDHHPQIREQIFHLGAIVEAHAADDAVADVGASKRLFDHARLSVRAIEDRNVGKAVSLGEELAHASQHEARLVTFVHGADDQDGVSLLVVGPELLWLAIGVARDYRVGSAEDALRRAVVLLELDQGGVREGGAEIQNVSAIRAAPSVDALVVVPDDT